MIIDPASSLQKAIYDKLSSEPLLEGIEVFDRVPLNASFPYIQSSELDIADNGDSCEEDAYEAFATIHVWSRSAVVGSIEAKEIGYRIKTALLSLEVAGEWALKVSEFQSARYLLDTDGVTNHGIVTFRFIIEPA